MAVVFVLVGGILQGLGNNYERYKNPDAAWGGLGVIIGGAISVWIARRLRWWLLLYIPAIWIAMIPIATASRVQTARFFRPAGNPDCQGWDGYINRLESIQADVDSVFQEAGTTPSRTRATVDPWIPRLEASLQALRSLKPPAANVPYHNNLIEWVDLSRQALIAFADGRPEDGESLAFQASDVRKLGDPMISRANQTCFHTPQ